MYQLRDYPPWVIVYFIRLADKHKYDLGLVSRILTSDYLVTLDDDYDANSLTPSALVSLIRLLFEEDQREQQKVAPASSSDAVTNWNGPVPPASLIGEAFERIYNRLWKRLTTDLITGVHQYDEQLRKLKEVYPQFDETQTVPSLETVPASKNGTPSLPSAIARPSDGKIASGAGPLAAPIPEVVKKQPSRTPTPTPPQPLAKRDSTPQALPAQPQPPALAQTQPPRATTPLRQLQPVPAAAKPAPNEAARPNGAAQVLQPPAGAGQALPPQIAPSVRPASPAILTPRPEPGVVAKGKTTPGVAQPTPAQPLKWEAPYQGPQGPQGPQFPAQRPLQPNVSRNLAPQTAPPPVSSKWHPPLPSGMSGARSASPHQVPNPPSQPVLAVPQTGQLPPPVPSGPKRSPVPPPPAQQPTPRLPPQVPGQQAQGPAGAPQLGQPPPPLQSQTKQRTASQLQLQQHQQQLQQLQKHLGAPSPSPLSTPGATPASLQQKRLPQPSQAPQTPQQLQTPQQPRFSPPPAALLAQSKQDATKQYVSPYTTAQPGPRGTAAPPLSRPARPVDGAKSDSTRNQAIQTVRDRLRILMSSTSSSQKTPSTPRHSPLLKTGHRTFWAESTPSTPARPQSAKAVESPAYELISPPLAPSLLPPATPIRSKKATPRSAQKADTSVGKGRTPISRGGRKTHRAHLGSVPRSQSEASQPDELSLDQGDLLAKVKDEESTPRPIPEETGDTTADESATSRRNAPLGSLSSRLPSKRKRQDSEPPPTGPPTQVLWTRGFHKVSGTALDQIGSHRHANMFANAIRERDAPNYSSIVLQPQDIQAIKKAIMHGHRFATQAAASLPGGDPGTAIVRLPISDDLVPPKGIINSAQLERELVHMFCNAIMYNPDPHRGPGPKFLRRSYATGGDGSVGYKVDEFGVVKNTRSMYVEVEKLLTDLRNFETQRNPAASSSSSSSSAAAASAGQQRQHTPQQTPQSAMPGPTRTGSVVTTGGGDDTADDDMDELAQDDVSSTSRRKRVKV